MHNENKKFFSHIIGYSKTKTSLWLLLILCAMGPILSAKMEIDIDNLVKELYSEVKSMLFNHFQTVERMAQALLEKETLLSNDIEVIMKGGILS